MPTQFFPSLRHLVAQDRNFRIFVIFIIVIFVVLVGVYWLTFFWASGDLKFSANQLAPATNIFEQLYQDKDLGRAIETPEEGCTSKIYELRLGELAEEKWSVTLGETTQDLKSTDLIMLCPQANVWGETSEAVYTPQEKDILSLVLTKCDQTFSTSCELMSRMVFGEEYDERPVWAFSEIQKKIGSFVCRTSSAYEYYGRPAAEVLVSDGEFRIDETIKDLHRHELHQEDGLVYAWLDESLNGYKFYLPGLADYLDSGGTEWGSENITLVGHEVLGDRPPAAARCRALADRPELSIPDNVRFTLIEKE